MASLIAVGSTELMYQHLAAIQSYARRVILQGDVLTSDEEEDRGRLMQEFLAVGSSFKLTGKEMAALICQEMLAPKRGCGCPSCRVPAPE